VFRKLSDFNLGENGHLAGAKVSFRRQEAKLQSGAAFIRGHLSETHRYVACRTDGVSPNSYVSAMSQLILAVHSGAHDAAAAVLIDYDLKAAVQLDRLTRIKGDGGYPGLSIDETLGMVGATQRDVDVLAVSRTDYPVQYFRHFHGLRWLRE
jgi:hypothetical protein